MKKGDKVSLFLEYLKRNGKVSQTKLQRETLNKKISGQQRQANLKNILEKDKRFLIEKKGAQTLVSLNHFFNYNNPNIFNFILRRIKSNKEQFKFFLSALLEKKQVNYEQFISFCPNSNINEYESFLNSLVYPPTAFEFEDTLLISRGALWITKKNLCLRGREELSE